MLGYNATVVVLLDQLDRLREPDWGQKLADHILWRANHGNSRDVRSNYPEPYVPGQAECVEVHHADGMMVVAVGGNCGRVIGYGGGYSASDEEIIKWLYQDLMRKKRDEKKAKANQEKDNG